jgi:hypothetical protein
MLPAKKPNSTTIIIYLFILFASLLLSLSAPFVLGLVHWKPSLPLPLPLPASWHSNPSPISKKP